jgi:ABC-type transport system involved in resistance to organic solvents, auxiliary component
MRTIKRWLAVWVMAFGLAGLAAAQEAAQSPEALVKDTTEKVLAALENHQDEIKANPQAVMPLVRDIVLPQFDFVQMSKLVLARNWREASPEQQQRFVEEFRELLIRTYGTSLSQYSGQKVNYLPNPPSPQPDRATVRTEIVQPSGPPIPVVYQLRQGKDGWKVFDVVIEGVSLVQNYRSTFNSEIQQGGIDGLISKLSERNRQGRS